MSSSNKDMNRYIKAMEIGLRNEDNGINYFDLFYEVKGTKDKVSSKEAEISFFMWFLQNFHNAEDRHYNDAELILEYRTWLIKDEANRNYHNLSWLKTEYKNYMNSKWFLNGQASKQYLDYQELQDSRIAASKAQASSTEANKKATISIWIAIFTIISSIGYGIYSNSTTPKPPFDVKIIEDKAKNKLLEKENIELKEKLYKAENLLDFYKEKDNNITTK